MPRRNRSIGCNTPMPAPAGVVESLGAFAHEDLLDRVVIDWLRYRVIVDVRAPDARYSKRQCAEESRIPQVVADDSLHPVDIGVGQERVDELRGAPGPHSINEDSRSIAKRAQNGPFGDPCRREGSLDDIRRGSFTPRLGHSTRSGLEIALEGFGNVAERARDKAADRVRSRAQLRAYQRGVKNE